MEEPGSRRADQSPAEDIDLGKEDVMYRFYIEQDQVEDGQIHIWGTDVNHMKNVLRLEPGDWVVACDKEGLDYVCRINSLDGQEVLLDIEKTRDSDTELGTHIVLFQGLPKKDKMELIIQKAVELGASEIVPVMMKRCVVKLSEDKKIRKKQERWQSIAEAAAKQCDRGIIPKVHAPVTMAQAFDMARGLEYNMIPYELQDGIEASRQVVNEACTKQSLGIFIGPEGGLEEEEVAKAIEIGAHPITLGKRILRTETAGMALLSILMFQMQD